MTLSAVTIQIVEEPQIQKDIIFLFALNLTMKDDYYLQIYHINSFQTLIITHLLHICKVFLEGSRDASHDQNTSILDNVFKYIDSTKRFLNFSRIN